MATPRSWERLTRRPDFLRAAASRRRCATPGLILQAVESPSSPAVSIFRLGFTASRKVGGAVERNRARRRLRAAAGTVMPEHAAPGMDYVLIARAETTRRPFRGLLADLEMALKRLDMWRGGAERGAERT
ncbi:MAG: ribonuclease P protein component [Rhodospirillales bacterium]|nr:ribonuclease P protein component [Rhodospirillales bacterium]